MFCQDLRIKYEIGKICLKTNFESYSTLSIIMQLLDVSVTRRMKKTMFHLGNGCVIAAYTGQRMM